MYGQIPLSKIFWSKSENVTENWLFMTRNRLNKTENGPKYFLVQVQYSNFNFWFMFSLTWIFQYFKISFFGVSGYVLSYVLSVQGPHPRDRGGAGANK